MSIQPRGRRSGKSSRLGLQRKLFHYTRFGGVPLLRRVWEICRIDGHLRRLSIVKRGHPAALLTYAYVLGGLIGARCLRQLVWRWRSDTYLSEGVGQGRRLGPHDFSRLLARYEFDPLLDAAVQQLQQWQCTAACPERGILVLDDTVLEKFGRRMQGAHSLYDHAKRRFVWGYALVNLLYAKGKVAYPVSFHLQSKPRRGRRPSVPRTKITLAMQLLEQAARQQLLVRAVVFDPAYCANRLLRHLDDLGYHWVSRLACTRIVTVDGKRLSVKQLARKRSWFRYDPVRDLHYCSRVGYLNGYELPVQIVAIRTSRGVQVLVSSLMHEPWQEILRLYRRRFRVEVFYRDAKQYFGLTDFRYRDLRRIRNHIALVMLRYLLLAVMRVAFPELAHFSWQEMKRRVLRTVQLLHGRRQHLRILLPPDDPLFRALLIRFKLHDHPLLA